MASEVNALFGRDVARYVAAVRDAVPADLPQHAFDALVSLCFNIGPGAFRRSTVVRRLAAGDRDGAAEAMLLWNRPAGGMFLWLRLHAALNAAELLPLAVARGVAFVPGAPFFADTAQSSTLRLSFVTANAEQIETGIGALGDAIRAALEHAP